MNKEINLDGINLSSIPNAPPANSIANRIIHSIECFNIGTNEIRKINISILITDADSKYYGIYLFHCADDGFFFQTITHNLYATYQEFRQPKEAEGWRFKSAGARVNAQVSGMLVSYGGFNAYLIDKEKLESDGTAVDIFAHDETISAHDTVIAQKAFHEQMWRGTIESARKRGVDEDLISYIQGK